MLFSILFLAISVSMDAFAVSISKGTIISQKNIKYCAILISLSFGLFHALMPGLGILITEYASHLFVITSDASKYIVFIVFLLLGLKMIYESFYQEIEDNTKNNMSLGLLKILILSFVTSIDALAVGVALPLMKLPIVFSILTIGITVTVFSFVGVLLGKKLSNSIGSKAELLGGCFLIFLAIKALF